MPNNHESEKNVLSLHYHEWILISWVNIIGLFGKFIRLKPGYIWVWAQAKLRWVGSMHWCRWLSELRKTGSARHSTQSTGCRSIKVNLHRVTASSKFVCGTHIHARLYIFALTSRANLSRQCALAWTRAQVYSQLNSLVHQYVISHDVGSFQTLLLIAATLQPSCCD